MTTYQITFNEKTDFGKNFLVFLEQNKKQVKVKNTIPKQQNKTKEKEKKDPTLMSKEEFYAEVEEARQQIKRGEYRIYDQNFRKEVMGLD